MGRIKTNQRDKIVNNLWKKLYNTINPDKKQNIVGLIKKLQNTPAEYDKLFDENIHEIDDEELDNAFAVCEEQDDYNFS